MSEGYHIDRKSRALKPVIALGLKYKLYLVNGAVYTRTNTFVGVIDKKICDYIFEHRIEFYNNRVNRKKGLQKLDRIIDNQTEFLDELKFQEDIQEEKHLDEILDKLPY